MNERKTPVNKPETAFSSEERAFLSSYDSSAYEKVSVAVDLLVFTIEDDELKILMIRRAEYPFKGYLALPGVFVQPDEWLYHAELRGIREETGLGGV